MLRLKGLLARNVCLRQLHCSRRLFDAKPFLMPAMSPTMEKGGVVEWKVKVGDTFAAGDLLLEVETDKAQIDVEAQDDGKLAKILYDNGSKDVSVGIPIAYLAEVDDDLATLTFDEPAPMQSSISESKEKQPPNSNSRESPAKKVLNPTKVEVKSSVDAEKILLPSVSILLAKHGISKNDAFEKIPATGKKGQLLKGDVLEFVGKISKNASQSIADYVAKGEKLDLSNIELKPPAPVEEPIASKTEKVETKTIYEEILIKLPKNVGLQQFQHQARQYIDSMYRKSHESLNMVKSQFNDPIFEELIVLENCKPRFKYDYDILVENPQIKPQPKQHDIFDLLSSKESTQKFVEDLKDSSCIIKVNLEINPKYPDALGKAEKFIEYLKRLQNY